MDVREAVKTAKSYIEDIFADEQIGNLGLEEVDFDDAKRVWKVTIGFTRTWNRQMSALEAALGQNPGRSYKTVQINDRDGSVRSMTHRLLRKV